MNIYLCSRVAKDAHELNNIVAKALRNLGHVVFVPHEQHYNQIMANTADQVSDEEIYTQDMNAMLDAELCVVVGRVGVDCSFEIGWFDGQGTPVFFYRPEGLIYERHPMWYEILTSHTYKTLEGPCSLVESVIRYNAHRALQRIYNKG